MTTLLYLVDTNTAIEAMRGRAPELRSRFNRHSASLSTSTVVIHELLFGVARSNHPAKVRRQVDWFSELLEVLPFDEAAAEHSADIRARLAEAGTPIGGYDVLIAGQARSRGLVVVTNNTDEFERVEGLRVEDWTRAQR
mgnify:CR=1 FL=1